MIHRRVDEVLSQSRSTSLRTKIVFATDQLLDLRNDGKLRIVGAATIPASLAWLLRKASARNLASRSSACSDRLSLAWMSSPGRTRLDAHRFACERRQALRGRRHRRQPIDAASPPHFASTSDSSSWIDLPAAKQTWRTISGLGATLA